MSEDNKDRLEAVKTLLDMSCDLARHGILSCHKDTGYNLEETLGKVYNRVSFALDLLAEGPLHEATKVCMDIINNGGTVIFETDYFVESEDE